MRLRITKCPHCHKKSNPFRFLIYTKWTIYKCGACGKKSSFAQKPLAILGGITGGIAGGLSFQLWKVYGLYTVGLLCIGTTAVTILVMWLFFSLHPEEDK